MRTSNAVVATAFREMRPGARKAAMRAEGAAMTAMAIADPDRAYVKHTVHTSVTWFRRKPVHNDDEANWGSGTV